MLSDGVAVVNNVLSGLLDLVYPPKCILCETVGEEILCESCLAQLITSIPPPYCLRCGQVKSGAECTRCVNYPEGLVRCRAVGVHDGDLASLIHHFKYHDRPMLAGPLAKVMADYLIVRAEIMNDLKFDAIVPVPLHPSRERKRGYNQSERLSRELGQILQVPVGRSLVRRTRNTKSQVGKHRDERLKNLENAFLADAEQCNGKVVLLVDDVTTTGTTMSECASALLSAGAVKVYSIALAAG